MRQEGAPLRLQIALGLGMEVQQLASDLLKLERPIYPLEPLFIIRFKNAHSS